MEDIVYINPYKLFVGAFIPNWLIERRGISAGAKLCYAKLCQFAGKGGVCFPKQETIASDMGIERRQAIRYIKELESHNLIFIQRIGLRCSNRYKFLYHPWMGDVTETTLPEVTRMTHQEVTRMTLPIERESKKENQKKENQNTKY